MCIQMITCKRKQKISSRKEAPLYWLLSWLAVNWKIANESSMFCLCCNVPGHYVLSLWAEKSCLWWGPCLYYLWLHGVPSALQEMQGLGKEPFEEELLGRVMCSRRLSSATSFALTASIWVLGLAQPLHLFARVHIHSFTSSLPSPKYTQEYTGALLLGHAEVTPCPKDLKNMWENGLQVFPCIFSLWEGWEPICRRTVFVILKLGSVLDNSTLSTHPLGGLN